MTTPVGLERGERAPDMVLPAADGTPTRFYAHAGGRPALVVLAGEGSGGALDALAQRLGSSADRDVSVHVVAPPALVARGLPFAVLTDAEGRAAGAYRTQGQPTAFLLDPNLRVRASMPFVDGAATADAVLGLLPQLSWDGDATVVRTVAPVLVVPDVLGPERCAELVDAWEREGNAETGVEASAEGRRGERLSQGLKRRRDHVVTDPDRNRALSTMIGRRVMPELSKAFVFRANAFEGFKIACYDATDRGFFRPHRDNLSPSTAHRRFALTLNLNEDYEGGQLRFGEYGPERYRPPAGAALLFSCANLHEVLDVTAGRRFVLLSFLFADQPRQTEQPRS